MSPSAISQPLAAETVESVVAALNNGANAFIVSRRRERFSPAGDLAAWNARVIARAQALLDALGVHPIFSETLEDRPPIDGEIPRETIFALLSEAGKSELFRAHLDLPADWSAATRHIVSAIWYLRYVAASAARMHETNKRPAASGKLPTPKRHLTSRQVLIFHMARAYEAAYGRRLAKHLSSDAAKSPFARWCRQAFGILADRAEDMAAAIHDAAYPLSTDEVDDLRHLTQVSALNIRDDMKADVFARLQRPAPS